jgi:hypothetical protein
MRRGTINAAEWAILVGVLAGGAAVRGQADDDTARRLAEAQKRLAERQAAALILRFPSR